VNGETETAGDAITGAVLAGALERPGATDATSAEQHHRACLNCGAQTSGAYCSSCGQPTHIHRSLLSLGHDLLHGVFHFEGKIWRTLPELFFHPGRLTRRYINGERAKFVSPMALFLFTVFLTFAVFSLGGLGSSSTEIADPNTQADVHATVERLREQLAELRTERENPQTSEQRRADLDREIAGLDSSIAIIESAESGDWPRLLELQVRAARGGGAARAESSWPPPDSYWYRKVESVRANPRLLLYKIKTNAYKFSWALIPLSLPFMWLMFFWRRDIHLYDHAIFITYSISFMMLLIILLSLAAAIGVSSVIWGWVLALAPPLHLYKQLRGTYGLTRAGALVRLFFLTIAILIVLVLFLALLLALGLMD